MFGRIIACFFLIASFSFVGEALADPNADTARKTLEAQNSALRAELEKFRTNCCPMSTTTCTTTTTCVAWLPALQGRAGGGGISLKLRTMAMKFRFKRQVAKYKAIENLARIHNGQTAKDGGLADAARAVLGGGDSSSSSTPACPAGTIPVRIVANAGIVEAKDSGEAEGHSSGQVFTCKEDVVTRARAAAILAGIGNPPPTAPASPAPAIIAHPIPEPKRTAGGHAATLLGGCLGGGALGFGLVYALGPKDEVFEVASGQYKHERNGELIVGTTIASCVAGAALTWGGYMIATR